jgi:hypothetical protein
VAASPAEVLPAAYTKSVPASGPVTVVRSAASAIVAFTAPAGVAGDSVTEAPLPVSPIACGAVTARWPLAEVERIEAGGEAGQIR